MDLHGYLVMDHTIRVSGYWLIHVDIFGKRYSHFGQFAPLGAEQTAAQLPGDWVSIGHSSQWLWYSVYVRYYIQ